MSDRRIKRGEFRKKNHVIVGIKGLSEFCEDSEI